MKIHMECELWRKPRVPYAFANQNLMSDKLIASGQYQ